MTRDKAIEIFSKGFCKFLERKGITQEVAGVLMDCSKANANKIKNGRGLPSVEGLFSLVENGMTLKEIFGDELAKKLLDSARNPGELPEGEDAERMLDLFSGVQKPSVMTEEEFDRKLKGSLKRLLGNLDIK